ncbi:hypothetical protein [Methylosinus sp. C49]|uniref:hypothetical protein n=1 Tax=Methylosinus sp. C49 TaxID=2699395 RepID=UPI00137A337A|nr:hypothetical protein [Methylosinus sp. C49]
MSPHLSLERRVGRLREPSEKLRRFCMGKPDTEFELFASGARLDAVVVDLRPSRPSKNSRALTRLRSTVLVATSQRVATSD